MVVAKLYTSQDFERTLAYVARVDSQHRDDPLPLMITSNLTASGLPHETGVRVMAEQMHLQSLASLRVQQPCYHIALSVPQLDIEGFDPLRWQDLTREFLQEMGLRDNQHVAYLHDDEDYPDGTPRPHVHLVVNRVGEYGQVASTSFERYRCQEVCRSLEERLGLTPEPSCWEVERRRDSPETVQRLERQYQEWISDDHERDRAPQKTQRRQLQESVDLAICRQERVSDVVDELRRQGIEVQVTKRGWSLKHGGIAFGGYQLGRGYTYPKVQERVQVEFEEEEDKFSPQAQGEVNDGELATKMMGFAQSRASASGMAVTDPIRTRTLGIIQVAPEEGYVSIKDEADGVKFEAIRVESGNEWEVTTAGLTPAERQALANVPQTVEGYRESTRGKSLIRALQILSSEEFEGEGGRIRIGDKSSGQYKYEAKVSRSPDGSQRIVAHQLGTDEQVLEARISEDKGRIQVTQASLPTQEVNSLVAEAEKVQRERNRHRRPKQRQLTRNEEELSL